MTLDNNLERIPLSLREIAETKPKSPELPCPILSQNKTLSKGTLGSGAIMRVRGFLWQARVTVAMLLIVKGLLKWMKMETWSHSGRCLVCK